MPPRLFRVAAMSGLMTLASSGAALAHSTTGTHPEGAVAGAFDDDDKRGRRRADDDRRGRRHSDEDSDSDSDSEDSNRNNRSRRPNSCVDRDRDGFCDVDSRPDRRARSLPDMIGAIILGRGQQSADAQRWLGGIPVRVASSDANRDGRPEIALFRDRGGQLVQVWRDGNRDGRADLVEIYRHGRLARVIR